MLSLILDIMVAKLLHKIQSKNLCKLILYLTFLEQIDIAMVFVSLIIIQSVVKLIHTEIETEITYCVDLASFPDLVLKLGKAWE